MLFKLLELGIGLQATEAAAFGCWNSGETEARDQVVAVAAQEMEVGCGWWRGGGDVSVGVVESWKWFTEGEGIAFCWEMGLCQPDMLFVSALVSQTKKTPSTLRTKIFSLPEYPIAADLGKKHLSFFFFLKSLGT